MVSTVCHRMVHGLVFTFQHLCDCLSRSKWILPLSIVDMPVSTECNHKGVGR